MAGLISNLTNKLYKTKNNLVNRISDTISGTVEIDEDLLEELEEILIQADIGINVSMEIIETLRNRIVQNRLKDAQMLNNEIKSIISELLTKDYKNEENPMTNPNDNPSVFLFIGVNGVGKTTTIGKLAKRYQKQGKKVMLIAADTFRAAAIEQLTIWSERASVDIVKQQDGADPASVIYDGLMKAKNNEYDIVLIDTAGRQHNKKNLMKELFKLNRTIKKVIPEAPNQSLLVVDATTGQNAISQAKLFNEILPVTGIILTKLDGTAKGGIVIGIKHEMQIPIRLIGVGEQVDDLQDFNSIEFAEALFG
ncbi:MAG: signal recognition particle-docking protein FtsY [Candidatus Cloacimonadota bacterium]|nr:signal recognition particle-docking protein FtsY [Candidatus Cloacimonadota bacterium]